MNLLKKIKPSAELRLIAQLVCGALMLVVVKFAPIGWLVWPVTLLITIAGAFVDRAIDRACAKAEKEKVFDMVRKCNWESKNEDGKGN